MIWACWCGSLGAKSGSGEANKPMARPSLYECYSGLTDYPQEKKLVQSQPVVTDSGGIDTCPMPLEPINGMYVTASRPRKIGGDV
uniref:Uncharacterized protein n=2 Tax=viral metagenome TaxID=1070528 RepID=A0A6M3IZJ3_9ZZZZ